MLYIEGVVSYVLDTGVIYTKDATEDWESYASGQDAS